LTRRVAISEASTSWLSAARLTEVVRLPGTTVGERHLCRPLRLPRARRRRPAPGTEPVAQIARDDIE
jgi:hypothetical protein